jgi:hypothetical protein
VLISQWRELAVDPAAEYRYGRYAQGTGNVHRTAVITDHEVASRKQRHHLSQIDFGWNNAGDPGERRAIPPRLDERQHINVRTPNEITGHGIEPLDRPTFLSYTRARMDSHQEMGRVGPVRPQEFGRP